MYDPVVFGIRKCSDPGLADIKTDISVKKIIQRAEKMKIKIHLPSPGSSGISTLGLVYLAGHEGLGKTSAASWDRLKKIITFDGSLSYLRQEKPEIKYFLKGHVPEIILENKSTITLINKNLAELSMDPYRIIIPEERALINDAPLGLVIKPNKKNENRRRMFFNRLQRWLLSRNIQKRIVEQGRGNVIPLKAEIKDSAPAGAFILPPENQIFSFLHTVLSERKKTVRSALLLDFSRSMQGEGKKKILTMLRLAFSLSRPHTLFNPSVDDIFYFMPFSHLVRREFSFPPARAVSLDNALHRLGELRPRGATSFYRALLYGLEKVAGETGEQASPALFLVTDGANNTGIPFSDFKKEYFKKYRHVALHIILFENADTDELKKITAVTGGKLLDGKKDIHLIRKIALGYSLCKDYLNCPESQGLWRGEVFSFSLPRFLCCFLFMYLLPRHLSGRVSACTSWRV